MGCLKYARKITAEHYNSYDITIASDRQMLVHMASDLFLLIPFEYFRENIEKIEIEKIDRIISHRVIVFQARPIEGKLDGPMNLIRSR